MTDEEVRDSIVAFVKRHGGSVQPFKTNKGYSFQYHWYELAVHKQRYFPAGLRPEDIKSEILRIQQNAVYQKAGMSSKLAEHRQKESRTTIMELAKWFIELSMLENVPAKHEFKEFKIDSAKNTMAGYEVAVRKFREFLKDREGTERVYMEQLTRDHINHFKRWMVKTGLSTMYANNILHKLQKIFRKARYENKLYTNPFQDFEYLKHHKSTSKRNIMTLDQMKLVADSEYVQKNPEIWLGWQIMRFTGMRGADLYRLKKQWLDLKNETYTVYVAKRDGQLLTRPFHHGLTKYLRQYFSEHKIKDDEAIFKTKPNDLKRKFIYSVARILPDIKGGTHTPRHSLSAYLRNTADWDHEWIGYFLLHTNKDITGVYTHEQDEKFRRMINQLPLDGGEKSGE